MVDTPPMTPMPSAALIGVRIACGRIFDKQNTRGALKAAIDPPPHQYRRMASFIFRANIKHHRCLARNLPPVPQPAKISPATHAAPAGGTLIGALLLRDLNSPFRRVWYAQNISGCTSAPPTILLVLTRPSDTFGQKPQPADKH